MKNGWGAVGLLVLLCALLLSAQANAAVPACTWSFTTGANAPKAIESPSAAVAGNIFYLFGGYESAKSSPINNTYAYNPVTDTWETKASVPQALYFSCAVALDDKIYLIGGFDSSYIAVNTLYVYDPEADTWTQLANLPAAIGAAACTTLNGKIYAAGNLPGSNVFYEYDPVGNTWTAKANLPGNVWGARATTRGGKLYVVGGWGATSNYEWTPGTPGTWAEKAVIPTASFANALIAPTIDDASWDLYWLFGQVSSWFGIWDNKVRFYDVSGNSWGISGLFGAMPAIHISPGAANFYNAYFIISTGFNQTSDSATTTIFKYCAPYVSWVDPAEVPNYDSAQAATIKGLNFDDQAGSGFWLTSAKADIPLTVTVTDSKTATTTLPADLDAGVYGIKVRSAFVWIPTQTTEDLLTVTAPEPEITSIDPDTAETGGEVDVTIEGNHFFDPVEVKIEGPSKAEIECESPALTGFTSIACTLDLTDAEAGTYDVVVTTDNGEGTLAGAFEVTEPAVDDDTDDDTGDDDTDDDTDDDDDDDDGGCGC